MKHLTLNKIEQKIEKQASTAWSTQQKHEEAAYLEFLKIMNMPKQKKIIKGMVKKLEDSKNLTSIVYDEFFHTWIRVSFSELIDTDSKLQCKLLEKYFQDQYCFYVDLKNDCLTQSIGPALVLNEDNDVYDQDAGKVVIDSDEYETEEQLNILIEQYMEKNGYFPNVITVDHYGNAYFVNIKGV